MRQPECSVPMPQLSSEFKELFAQEYPNEANALFQCLEETSPSYAIRLNAVKSERYGYSLDHLQIEAAVPWYKGGFTLTERPVFAWDPLWHAAGYYVQEASSQAISQVKSLLPSEPIKALDLCAAPGGKASLLSSILPNGSLLIANEPIPKRASTLVENIAKWGYPETIVTSVFPEQLASCGILFDLILVDAPCSGEGMFRKSISAREDWSLDTVALCSSRQKKILDSAFDLLRPGGLIVYSTCTFNRRENEEQVAYLHSKGCDEVALEIPTEWNWVQTSTSSYHLFPHRLNGEGLFFAVLRKNAKCGEKRLKDLSKIATQSPKVPYKDWILDDRFQLGAIYALEGGLQFLMSESVECAYRSLCQSDIKPIFAGIPLTEKKGNGEIPHSLLPLSMQFSIGAFDSCSLEYEDALRYLSGAALSIESKQRGLVTLTYQGIPLGFGNRVGQRINSNYPKSYRLKLLP